MWKTTHWSQILEAQQQNQYAIENLCKDYWEPVYKFACKYYKNDAEDITQEFFAKFLENKWITKVSKTKGKFRTFLIITLIRFIRDKYQGKQVRFEKDMVNLKESVQIQDFNRYWIENLLSLIARRMHSKYQGNLLNYIIFRMYYYHAHSAFFRPEDIVSIDSLLDMITKQQTNIDRFLYCKICNMPLEDITYIKISEILNSVLENNNLNEISEVDVKETYYLTLIDWKVTNWKAFALELMKQLKPLAKKYKWFDHTEKYIINFLNRVIKNEDLEDSLNVPATITNSNMSTAQKNRTILEYVYSQYIEKYQIRLNRKILELHYGQFFVPYLNEDPSLAIIANQLNVSKYQIEKSLKETAIIYKEIMRDEVSRYVYPPEVSDEIAYLQALL
ncbi:RNA polymerase sigma factor [Candidatus Uabimicrobium sp. HlEnr_7]|uniref:RNA polymerase sigma factor n=1 Tax=Candidatus Uabimicrobium helgolandensis TaxID=3095367 RepID=UPI003558105A